MAADKTVYFFEKNGFPCKCVKIEPGKVTVIHAL